MAYNRIVLLAGEWDTTAIVYHFLKQHTGVEKAIIEKPVPRNEFLKRRAKKLGWITVGGQVLFQILIAKPLARTAKQRIAQIVKAYNFNTAPIPEQAVEHVSSINEEACLQTLQTLQPDLVVVHGTRIISKRILKNISCPFINIHAGITPRYRGSHGGYWALANGDREHCGVTVHLVDAGIDTGNILFQKPIPVTSKDNFVTYPYLQLAEGLLLLKKAIQELEERKSVPLKNDLDSALWHHPTLWSYLWKRISKGVK